MPRAAAPVDPAPLLLSAWRAPAAAGPPPGLGAAPFGGNPAPRRGNPPPPGPRNPAPGGDIRTPGDPSTAARTLAAHLVRLRESEPAPEAEALPGALPETLEKAVDEAARWLIEPGPAVVTTTAGSVARSAYLETRLV